MDIGGVVPNYKLVPNKPESEFLTSQVEYYQSCGFLGPSLAVKHPMKTSSLVCYLNANLSPPASTTRPPDVIHVISIPRPSLFFPKMLVP